MVNYRAAIKYGEPVAVKIKEIYFADKAWSPELAFSIGRKLAQLKRSMRVYYPEELDMLQTLEKYTHEEIKEAFEVMEDEKCKGSPPKLIGQPIAHCMEMER